MSDVAVVDSILGRGERAEVDRDDGPGDREDGERVGSAVGGKVGEAAAENAGSRRVEGVTRGVEEPLRRGFRSPEGELSDEEVGRGEDARFPRAR